MFKPKESSQNIKKIATHLARLEKVYCNKLGWFASLLIGAEDTRLLRDVEVTGDPAGAKARPLKKSVKFNAKLIPENSIPTSSL